MPAKFTILGWHDWDPVSDKCRISLPFGLAWLRPSVRPVPAKFTILGWHDWDPVSEQCRLSLSFWLAWLWPNAGGVGSVSVPRLGQVLASVFISRRCDCGPMPAVLAAGLRPVYLGRFWVSFIPCPCRVWQPQPGQVISSGLPDLGHYQVKLFWLPGQPFTFYIMHLADTFIQSDLECIQAKHFLSVSPLFVALYDVYGQVNMKYLSVL